MKKIILTFQFVFFFVAVFSQIPKDSLKVCYKFDGTVDDVSGNGKNAMVNGTGVTLTTDRSNNANSAYNFDGVDGDISANIGEIKDNLTISFWYLSANQTQPYPHFFDYGDYKVRCHIMSGSIYNTTDRNAIYLETYNPSASIVKGSQKPGDNKWTHVVISFNKSANELKLYVDGVLDKQGSVASADLTLSDGIIVFGRVRTGGASAINSTRFKGKLDDIFIYSKILTQTEITALFNGDNVASVINESKPNFNIYPNPFSNELNVKLSFTDVDDVSYKLTDITGKVISEGTYSSTISTAELNTGVYLLSVYQNNSLLGTKKVIKQ